MSNVNPNAHHVVVVKPVVVTPKREEPPREPTPRAMVIVPFGGDLFFNSDPLGLFSILERSVNAPPVGNNGNNSGSYSDFKQGQTGDCGVLSAIMSTANDKDGKAILDKSLTRNQDGSYDVRFAGAPNEVFHVSAQELGNTKLSNGDAKVKALEIAFKKYQEAHGKKFEGTGGAEAIKLLTGKTTTNLKDTTHNPGQLKQALLGLARKDGDGLSLEIGASKLNGEDFGGMHAISITNIDPDTGTVSYKNPWHAGKTETMSLDQLVSDMSAPSSGGIDFAEV